MNKLFANLLLITLVGLVFGQATTVLIAQTPEHGESVAVQQYLERLQLDSILIEHLQQQLDQTPIRSEQIVIASELAGLYSKSVFTNGNLAESQTRLERIGELANRFPEIDSPELKMTVLHSEYASVEKSMIAWLTSSPRSETVRGNLQKQLLDLGRRTKDGLNRFEQSLVESDNSRFYLQANYLYAWVCYYRGLTEDQDRELWMTRSDESFRDFLELETKRPVSQFSAHWFNLQSPWHARAMVGMGMALRALGKEEESKFCFKILESAEADANIRKNLDVWRLNSYLYLQKMDDAFAFLRRRAASSRADDQKRTRLWVASIEAATSPGGNNYSQEGVRFLRFGLHGLVADLNAPILVEVVQQNDLNLAGEDFLLAWCRGYLDFYRAGQTRNPDDFVSAKRELNWAIHSANSAIDKIDLAKCHYLLGWIEFQLKEYESAAQLWQQAIPELVEHSPELASEAQWMTVRSMQMLAKQDPRFANEAFNAMDVLVRSFPDSRYVRRVEFEKLLMEVSKFPPAEALRRLQIIQADDPNYNEAVFQQLKLQHRVWQENQKLGSRRLRISLDQLLESELVFQQLYPSPPVGQRVKAALLSADALIRTGENGAAAKRIAVAEQLSIERDDPTSPLTGELRYYQFQLARSENDLRQMKVHADWFYLKQPESIYSESILVALTQELQKLRSADGGEPFDIELLTQTYERLVNLLGTGQIQLIDSKNARVAATRLVAVYYEAERYDKADALVVKLLDAFPNRKDFLQWSARVKMKTDKLVAAIGYWRTVVKAVEPGSDDWFEAKLGVIQCLAADNATAAKAVLKQTMALTGDRSLPDQWQKPFADMGASLDAELDAQTDPTPQTDVETGSGS